MLDRLQEMNQERWAAEVVAGMHAKAGGHWAARGRWRCLGIGIKWQGTLCGVKVTPRARRTTGRDSWTTTG